MSILAAARTIAESRGVPGTLPGMLHGARPTAYNFKIATVRLREVRRTYASQLYSSTTAVYTRVRPYVYSWLYEWGERGWYLNKNGCVPLSNMVDVTLHILAIGYHFVILINFKNGLFRFLYVCLSHSYNDFQKCSTCNVFFIRLHGV